MTKEEILEFAKQHGYTDIFFLGTFKGYRCYEPYNIKDLEKSGLSIQNKILIKGDEIRISTTDETNAIFDLIVY